LRWRGGVLFYLSNSLPNVHAELAYDGIVSFPAGAECESLAPAATIAHDPTARTITVDAQDAFFGPAVANRGLAHCSGALFVLPPHERRFVAATNSNAPVRILPF